MDPEVMGRIAGALRKANLRIEQLERRQDDPALPRDSRCDPRRCLLRRVAEHARVDECRPVGRDVGDDSEVDADPRGGDQLRPLGERLLRRAQGVVEPPQLPLVLRAHAV